jgi:hypothetical protein
MPPAIINTCSMRPSSSNGAAARPFPTTPPLGEPRAVRGAARERVVPQRLLHSLLRLVQPRKVERGRGVAPRRDQLLGGRPVAGRAVDAADGQVVACDTQ